MERRNRRLSCLSLVVFTISLCLATLVQCAAVPGGKQVYVPNEYIVRVAAGTSLSAVRQAATRMGGTLVSQLAMRDTYLVKLGLTGGYATYPMTGAPTQAAKWVIEEVQPNYLYYPCAVPNDESWDKLWNMRLINMPGAWEVEKGSTSVTVAVNDTGVANHPELTGRIVAGTDTVDNDNDPSDDVVGHGTHCAGIIAAQGNNGLGVCGVAWGGVKIMPIRVLGPEGGTTAMILGGLDYALTHGADVVSMSYGSYGDDPAKHSKLQELAEANIILVAAAGNESTNYPAYPASYSEVISVAAIGPYDDIAYYSNYGKIDIAAPGGDASLGQEAEVYSTFVTWNDTTPTMTYEYMQGTSMACPHVSGASAILLSYGVPASEVRNRLSTSARRPSSGNMDASRYGAGILNVQGALSNASIRIVAPGKGSTVGPSPDFRMQIQGISISTVKIYLDYADLNDDGIPDNANEGVVMSGVLGKYLQGETEIHFNWSDIAPPLAADPTKKTPMTAGSHNLYITADATAGGDTASDWAVFTVANTKISKGIHLFAFPYAFSDRMTSTPATVLPGTVYDLAYGSRSSLWRYLSTPQSALVSTPIGYDMYLPGSTVDRVWNNPFWTVSGTSVPTGGGYYYHASTHQRQYTFPAGSGFWLVLPNDVWIDASVPTLDTEANFDGSKGFEIPLYGGYNLIGNPYAHTVPWRTALFTYRGQTKTLLDAESAGWVRSALYSYGGTGSDYVRVTDRDMLEPYNGYWLYALIGGAAQGDSLVLSVLP